jgi:hypothetical protein
MFSLIPIFVSAQYYQTGVDDNKIRWRQIQTSDFHIVFPDFYEVKAQELARVLQTTYGKTGLSLNVSEIPNVPFLLHPLSVESNGLVVWAPKRTELWTMEPHDSYSFPWLWQLAIHEGRHTAQMKALYQKGGGKLLYSIFGEHIVGALLAIYVPYWFLEGDAVVSETALAPYGRGDSPLFDFEFKAMALDKGKMGFDKAKMGSMQDFVPNRYNLGYHLVSFAREKYGKNIWGSVLNEISSNFWKLKFWGETDRKGFKISSEKLYDELMDSLLNNWKHEDSLYMKDTEQTRQQIRKIGKSQTSFANYYSPRFISQDSVLALRKSYDRIPQLVLITDSCEQTLTPLPFILNNHFEYSNGKIVFSQYYPHKRWQHTSFSDIAEYDLKQHNFKRLTHNQRLFLPYFDSAASNGVTAIENDTLGNISLTSSGYFIKTFPQGKAIIHQNKDLQQLITNPTYSDIIKMRQIGKRIFYIEQIGNTYQLFSFPIANPDEISCHTNVRFGAFDFDVLDSLLVISDYTAEGCRIKTMPLQTIEPKSYKMKSVCNADKLRAEEGFVLSEKNVIDTTFQSTEYKKSSHLFNFHSLAPFALSMESQTLDWGISGMSQNLLGTSLLELGYKYLWSENRDDFFIDYYYKGLYPIINVKFDFLQTSFWKSEIRDYQHQNEVSSIVNAQLPLSWYGFISAQSLNIGASIGYRNVNWHSDFGIIGFNVMYQAIKPMAQNDIVPQLGEKISISTLTTTGYSRNGIIAATSTTYLPSVWNNHAFQFTASWQYRKSPLYYFSDLVNVTRGYEQALNHYLISPQSSFFGVLSQYVLPLWYPDLAVWKLVYIKRIAAKPFYDFGFSSHNFNLSPSNFVSSVGSDILFNANFLRLETTFEIGVRIGYMIEEKSLFAKLLLNLNI